MSDVAPSRGFERIRSTLDVVATAMVIAAAGAVFALTIWIWNERHVERQATGGPPSAAAPFSLNPPDKPQSISGVPIIGAPEAKLAVIEYSDFQCPYCAQYVKDVWPTIKAQYVDSGKVRYAFKHFPLDSHAHSRAAALGAECAHRQGRFGDMHDLLFAASGSLSTNSSLDAARQLGLDLSAFRECITGTDGATRIESDINGAKAIGVQATPWFLVGRVMDSELVKVERVIVGMTSFDNFKSVLDALNATGETVQ